MKVLITGATGQRGRRLQETLRQAFSSRMISTVVI